jgi:hypothetical protein
MNGGNPHLVPASDKQACTADFPPGTARELAPPVARLMPRLPRIGAGSGQRLVPKGENVMNEVGIQQHHAASARAGGALPAPAAPHERANEHKPNALELVAVRHNAGGG